jgi:hypothetical protein
MRFVTLASAMLVSTLTGVALTAEAQIPAEFTNLQVLPKDTARADLIGVMKSFSGQLGVRCEHCHMGEGNDLSKFDFASDARPAKATARRMVTMTAAINTDHLKGIGEPYASPKVTCFTYHRGATKPLTAAGGGDLAADR